MNKVFAILFNRWTLALVVLAALALLIWLGGALLAFGSHHPLDSPAERWICIGVLTVLVLGLLAWRSLQARRSNQAVVEQLIARPASSTAAESPDLQAVRQRFEAALQTLRRARFAEAGEPGGGLMAGWAGRLSGRYLYELPWYLIIGAPGSGKTTALCNSGLGFPLAEAGGGSGPAGGAVPGAVPGVGGTRHCDWWFTDRAVLIDTAGRFTTQDSDRDNDRATWTGFLALLKKSRPRQPVNGVLVTVSVSDLLTRNAAERAEHAATVRLRLQELHEQLGIRFPIYLLVTKADLLAGFMDYFGTLDKAQRADPWGHTFDLDPSLRSDLGTLAGQFDALVQRLDAGLVERLQQERDAARRARIYGFPAQLAGLREQLQEFVGAVFSASRFEPNPLLRGVYLVSGTQEGSPIDRLLGVVARNFRLERAILPPQQASGRSYFLTRLLTDVVFAEHALAGTNLRWERRRQALTLAGYVLLGFVGVGVAAASLTSHANNRAYVAAVEQQAREVSRQLQAAPGRAGSELLPLLGALDATRQVASPPAAPAGVGATLGWGLFQGDKLDRAAAIAYERMLVDAVLPRLAQRIEEQLRDASVAGQNEARNEVLYETLRAHLMLHDISHFDAAAIKAYVEHDWDRPSGLAPSAEQRERLGVHLDALLALGRVATPLPPDDGLVAAARSQLARTPLPQRVYQRMRRQGLGDGFPAFSVARSAGAGAPLVFARASGAPLSQGVPGLYTFEGYHRGFQGQVEQISRALAAEQPWVLGAEAAQGDSARLAGEVRRLYLNDYAATWEAYIADVRLQPITSVPQAIQMARLLSAPDTPLVPLLKEMARHTTLAAPLEKGLLQKAEGQARGVLQQGRDVLADLQGRPTPDAAPARLEQQLVDDRFTALRQYVTAPEGGKPPIDGTVALLGEVHVFLNAVDTALKAKLPMPPSELPNRLKSEAPRLPQPVRSIVDTLASSGSRAAMLGVRQALSNEVRANISEFCQQAIGGRYPFDRRSGRDVTPADFALLFAPGGKFDRYVQERLLPYVDTASKPWRFIDRGDGNSLGSDGGTLAQFQRAAAIRDAFFPAGNTPLLRAEFKPLEMDGSISQLLLDIDGQVVRYSHGPQIPTPVQWPGTRGSNQIRLQVTPAGATAGQLIEGPWALLRLFDARQIEPGRAPERFRSVFDFDGRKATFEITASSVRNPFTLRELGEFSCPNGL